MSLFRTYYQLCKPGIIYGNAITAMAGFFLAAQGHFNLQLFLVMLVGLSLVIASGCVFNNLFDKDIDIQMERTRGRALVSGKVSQSSAVIYATTLLILGILVLHYFANNTALFVALTGFFVYVCLYTPLKRRTLYSTIVGSIAGAVPPVVGYVAVTNGLDLAAGILFLILVFWQMPHFYAIAIYRLNDYQQASVPILPIVKGIKTTKIHIVIYTIAFIAAAASLTYFHFAGFMYLAAVGLLGLSWLRFALKGFSASNDALWAKKMFRFSLIVLTLLCLVLSLNAILP